MPAYSNTVPPSAIWPGDSAQVWNAEQPTAGNGGASASQRVAIGSPGGSPGGFSVTGFFSAAPGSFEKGSFTLQHIHGMTYDGPRMKIVAKEEQP